MAAPALNLVSSIHSASGNHLKRAAVLVAYTARPVRLSGTFSLKSAKPIHSPLRLQRHLDQPVSAQRFSGITALNAASPAGVMQ